MKMAALISLPFILFFLNNVSAQSTSFNFTFNGFNGANISLEKEAGIRPSGALRLTDNSPQVIGYAFYPDPIQMFQKNSSSTTSFVSSFSTNFVFSITTPPSSEGGYGLAFAISPSTQFLGAHSEHYLGLFNSSTENQTSNHIFAVEFDTVNGYNESTDSKGNHVGINVNSMHSVESEPAEYYPDDTKNGEELFLDEVDAIQAWIEYDGFKKMVNVTIAPRGRAKPSRPLLSHVYDLSTVLKESMYVGFSSSTGKKASSHYILGWSFLMNGTSAPSLDPDKLPAPPKEKAKSSLRPEVKAFIAALSIITIFLLAGLFLFVKHRRKLQVEILEEWELDCPHRFRYKDLYVGTKGFKESEVIGVGGFGAVYKGVFSTDDTRCEFAVKKIAQDSIQGMREFAAEIESLGRLRHKNLVNLQGWCKQKKDLLLVYDYVPNGSLDSLLYNPRNGVVLSWVQRFNIIKGVASALLYLHEEWEQVVIHRDVKSSNVLIDAEMNARLGDFGLARLYNHGTISHTTNVVGTIGYIPPELARTGKASESSDVFAYGILLLEVACGRRPIDPNSQHGNLILVDWVIECHRMGRMHEVVDPNLNSAFVVQEMELVLSLGIVCSHPRAEARPSMRQVTKYLNGDEPLPDIGNWGLVRSPGVGSMNSRFMSLLFTTDTSAKSYGSSSISNMSSKSIKSGR